MYRNVVLQSVLLGCFDGVMFFIIIIGIIFIIVFVIVVIVVIISLNASWACLPSLGIKRNFKELWIPTLVVFWVFVSANNY